LIENSQLLKYVGETWNEKLKNQISKEYFELKQKQSSIVENNVSPMSIVRVSDPNETEIKSIGMSCINDILNDNWGNFLRGFFSGTAQDISPMTDSLNANKPIRTNGTVITYNSTDSGAIGTQMQIGKGLTSATRQDFNIGNPFVSAPEEDPFDTGFGGYNSGLGQVTVGGLLTPTGGAGAISETVLFAKWRHIGNTINDFVLSRDNISPVVNFIIGQAVNVEYILQLS